MKIKIKVPATSTIFQAIDTGEIYLYSVFNKKINGHMLFRRDGDYVTYLAVCISEFETNYFKIGRL